MWLRYTWYVLVRYFVLWSDFFTPSNEGNDSFLRIKWNIKVIGCMHIGVPNKRIIEISVMWLYGNKELVIWHSTQNIKMNFTLFMTTDRTWPTTPLRYSSDCSSPGFSHTLMYLAALMLALLTSKLEGFDSPCLCLTQRHE